MGAFTSLAKRKLKALAAKKAAAAKSVGKEVGKHVDDLVGPPKSNAAGIKKVKKAQSSNTNSRATGRKYAGVATVVVAGLSAAALRAKLATANKQIKEAKTETAKAKARANKEIINTALAKVLLEEEKSSAPKTSTRPKSRPKPMRPKSRP